jgi:hypothetical protein
MLFPDLVSAFFQIQFKRDIYRSSPGLRGCWGLRLSANTLRQRCWSCRFHCYFQVFSFCGVQLRANSHNLLSRARLDLNFLLEFCLLVLNRRVFDPCWLILFQCTRGSNKLSRRRRFQWRVRQVPMFRIRHSALTSDQSDWPRCSQNSEWSQSRLSFERLSAFFSGLAGKGKRANRPVRAAARKGQR